MSTSTVVGSSSSAPAAHHYVAGKYTFLLTTTAHLARLWSKRLMREAALIGSNTPLEEVSVLMDSIQKQGQPSQRASGVTPMPMTQHRPFAR